MTLADPSKLRVTLMLADWAEALGGKLYIQGGGWARIVPNRPVTMAVAALLHVPYDQTNTPITLTLSLLTEDAELFPQESPFQVQANAEVGRPPGMRAGEETVVPFAVKVNGIQFKPGGYRVEARVGDDLLGYIPFTAVEKPAS